MAAKQKVVVATVKHPTLKGEVEVTMTAGEGIFRAKVRGSDIHADTLEGIRREVLARLEATAALEWVPIIELKLAREGVRDFSDKSKTAAGASLSFKRYWFALAARLNDGKKDDHRGSWSGKMMAPWDCKTDAARLKKATNCYITYHEPRTARTRTDGWLYDFPRHADGSLAFPAQVHEPNGEGAYLLLHTDALWMSLEAIVVRLHDTRALLRTMVSTAANVARLEGLGTKLIMAGGMLALPGATDVTMAEARVVPNTRGKAALDSSSQG